ncbi:MAG: hypothetical protein WAU88_06325 [Candidatus Zixiibacteriota bacterium]
MTNLYDAHNQWLERPPDERFPDLNALYCFVKGRRERSSEEARQLRHVALVTTPDGAIAVNGETPPAYLTNWAFSQLAINVGAPAKYLRTLPPDMVRDCLRHGLDRSGERCKLLLRSDPFGHGSGERLTAAAFTSPTYGRIWDSDVIESLMHALEGTGWHVPPAHPSHGNSNAGLYASDRDMFAFFVNDDHPVAVGDATLGRGFFLWNSETGAATFGLTTFLYNYVCGNHIVWGADQVSELRIVHRHRAPDRLYRDALPILNRFVEETAVSDRVRYTVERAMAIKISGAAGEVLDWFSSKPFTKFEVVAGYQAGLNAGDDVSTVWGMVQGLTAAARTLPHTDARVNLERRAGSLLS